MGHMLKDGRGRLWIATGKGITRYDPESGTFRNYDKKDGLSSNESRDFAKGPLSGRFLLSTINGLAVFHPDSLNDNPAPPPVVFTKIARYDRRAGKEIVERGISQKQELAFSYRDNILNFEFAALSFRKPSKNQYA